MGDLAAETPGSYTELSQKGKLALRHRALTTDHGLLTSWQAQNAPVCAENPRASRAFLFDAIEPAGRIIRMNTRIISALIALVAIAFIASSTPAQTPAPQPSAPPTTVTSPVVSAPATTTASPNEAEMMKQMMELAKLNENHKLLADLAGSWSTSVKMMEPGQEPSVSKGNVTYKSIMNGRYFIGDHAGSMKMPGADGKMKDFAFKGMSIDGYDNVKQKFTSSWMDNMGTGIMTMEGTYDPATKTFTYTGEMEMPPGMKTPVRAVVKITDKNHHTFEWYENRGGQEMKTLEINYTRKK
jgi:hypothetical protein